jgi:hypothetical protein
MKAILTRYSDDGYQTLGTLEVFNGSVKTFNCVTLELPWNDNKKKESCIPVGDYKVIKRSSEKYAQHFHIQNVPNRDYILIHPANKRTELLGCIAPGDSYKDINGDGNVDVLNSKKTLAKLYSLMPDEFELTIV